MSQIKDVLAQATAQGFLSSLVQLGPNNWMAGVGSISHRHLGYAAEPEAALTLALARAIDGSKTENYQEYVTPDAPLALRAKAGKRSRPPGKKIALSLTDLGL